MCTRGLGELCHCESISTEAVMPVLILVHEYLSLSIRLGSPIPLLLPSSPLAPCHWLPQVGAQAGESCGSDSCLREHLY